MKVPRILVADGDPLLLRTYSRLLQASRYEVLQAASGEEALRVCQDEHPDLVLLDCAIPGLDPGWDGLDTCRRIKSDPALTATFVILLSGQDSSTEMQIEGLEAGADGYLGKPIEQRALLAHIRALLRIKRTEQELRESEERQRLLVEDLKEANRRLEEYNRLKAEFVANMSHELRTPLTAIIGFVQLVQLSEGDKIQPQYARAFERILRNGRHLLSLIDDVLDIAKIEAGRMRIHREHFDLVEVVQSAFSELQSLARQGGLDYRLRVQDDLPLAFSDPLRVRQIVTNLLSNAIKFTPEGSVEAELSCADGQCRFVVRDTGVGIEPAAMGLIFERFRQVDGSMSRLAGGAGLGLSIVRQIVELLGGTIGVESEVGKGSVFTVRLPLTAPDPDYGTAEPSPLTAAESAGTSPGTGAESGEKDDNRHDKGDSRPLVLVVEDDPDASALLSETIAGAGYRVRVAPTGSVGLFLARELAPAIITLDVMMPGMDGWRVLQSLKSERRTAEIPVIVCSIVDNRPLGYRLGASDYLIKPVGPEQLTEALRRVSSAGENEESYVLVVDSEQGARELLVKALQRTGYKVRSASSGETALRLIAESVPRAVLCDLMMPGGMSGYELIARLRSDPRTEHTPILVVTGKEMMPEDRRLVLGQITDLIRKGDLLISDLESRLRETLEHLGVTPTYGENPAG